LRIRKGLLQLSRQTGSPGFVISDNAVLDCHMHWANALCGKNSRTARIVAADRVDAKGTSRL
jgi:hypothetical protein